MSWQRILRFAKQRQVPVIITDESGEEPLILLSLDQLEQALDGGAGPDLPPPAPAPRPTTPSFVPEYSTPSPDSDNESVSVEPPPIQTESAEPPATPLPAVLSTFAELEQAAVVDRPVQPIVNIVTPPEPEEPKKQILEEVVQPVVEPKKDEPAPPSAPPATSPTRPDLSLEERFFLDF